MPIRVLAPQVIAKIAAGEVVERPASVVKELVENAIDAGATHVTIEVESGGVKLVRVSDDGHGIACRRDGPSLSSVTPPAKSASSMIWKRRPVLGFRGEALPSIASVSRMSLYSRATGN